MFKLLAKLISWRESGNWNVRLRDNLSKRRHNEKAAQETARELLLAKERYNLGMERRGDKKYFSENTIPADQMERPPDEQKEHQE